MKIFLIGLPGSGKTTLGKKLAKEMNLRFFDLDKEVERQEQMPISEIFAKKGEDYFRRAESTMLAQIASSNGDFVLSTGGGAPCFHDNMIQMNQVGTTVFLDVPTKEIARRLGRSDLKVRPLFASMNPDVLKDKIEFLRSQRSPFYQQAKVIIQSPTISTEDLIEHITK